VFLNWNGNQIHCVWDLWQRSSSHTYYYYTAYIYIYIFIFIYTCLNATHICVDYKSCNYFDCEFGETRGLWQGFLDTRATEVVLLEMRPPTMWWSCKHRLLSYTSAGEWWVNVTCCSVLTNKEHVEHWDYCHLLPVARVVMIGRLVRKFYKAFTWWLDIWDLKIYLRQRHLHILNVNK